MLAILTTHPIQYQVPLWQELDRRKNINFEVWYLSDHGVRPSLDKQFNKVFQWDLDMLGGYPYTFIQTPEQMRQTQVSSFRGPLLTGFGQRLRQQKVTALWVNGWQTQAYWQAALQAHQRGVPVWLRGETNDLHISAGAKAVVRKIILKQLFNRISNFLVIGSANKRFYKQFGVPERKMTSAPYCVDDQRFAISAEAMRGEREQIRAKWGIPSNATCFLFAGKLIPKKRPLDILAAMERLASRQHEQAEKPNIHLLVVGTGELQQKLDEQAKNLETLYGRPVVTFTGFLNQAEIPQAYSASDCLLLPSDSGETWGLVVNEALACGLPAIVSDQCGCAEDLALPLGPDFVYKCGDTAQLAMSMALALPQLGSAALELKRQAVAQRVAMINTVEAVEHSYQLFTRKAK